MADMMKIAVFYSMMIVSTNVAIAFAVMGLN
ncbi:hypothetical protein BBC0178_005070 [Bartonella apihabitans]|uniref:Uncharacterized protein n=1 Tax=Bartonella apihabitans TaxID=2750929 RepID=A0A1U9M9K2_9HYPH|nr:hypothetical protein BBC0178_005070 [Bartonella apihabitans]AQT44241.1 hypothetical protein BBC0244_005190 [Bartonella apihabitans]